jgi:LemA protein
MFAIILVGVVVGVAVLLLAWAVDTYNGFLELRDRIRNAFERVGVQLKRRNDLIPNLVGIASGYLAHECGTLEALVEARNQAAAAAEAAADTPAAAAAMKALAGAESVLRGTLDRLMVVVERQPDLKLDRTMMQLQEEIASAEKRIAFALQAYNDEVMTYNTRREVFPDNLIVSAYHFVAAEPFEMETASGRKGSKSRL